MSRSLETTMAEVYEAAASGRFLDLLPDLVTRNADARSCVVQKTDSQRNPVVITHSWFTAEMARTYVDEQIYLDDVWANCAVEHGIYDRTMDIGEMTGRERYTRSRFFQDFILPFGDDTGHCLGALIRRPGGGFLTYGTHRAARADAFSGHEAQLLNRLNPHFLRALAIDEKLAECRSETDHMRVVLDRLERPVITVAPSRKVTLANAAAEAIAARGDGLLILSGRLGALEPPSGRRLAEAIDAALTHTRRQGGNLLIERRGGKPPYRLSIDPMPVGGVTHAMILIDDPESEPIGAVSRLHALYGFTRAEAEVAVLIAQGFSTEEIAIERNVGLATVKTLLQRCFRKSDTNRATQLALLVNRLPGSRPY